MKVLVIDHDPTISKSFEELPIDTTGLQALRSGDAAIRGVKNALKRRDPFELIAIDIDLPDMDGRKVILEIRKIEQEWSIPNEKRAFVMMVTAKADAKSVKTSFASGCNAFIVKPFNVDTVVKTLAKSKFKSELTGVVQKEKKAANPIDIIMRRLETGKIQMASLPDVSVKLNEMAKKGLDVKLIGDFIRKDLAITAKIMTVSNSAYYGAASKTKTVDEAISRIGLSATKQYVDAICNRKLFVIDDEKYVRFAEELWKHSLYCAIASQNVVNFLELDLDADAFSIGLLHDIGKIFLLQMTAELEAKGQLSGKIDLVQLFNSMEKYHNAVGAKALKHWKFSGEYFEGALFHDDLEKKDSPSQQLLVLHFANALAKNMLKQKIDASTPSLFELESAHLLKITPDMVVKIEERIKAQLPLFS
jgi:HD-like signal output (HDOD) protein/CheY-like chemotaxis protein